MRWLFGLVVLALCLPAQAGVVSYKVWKAQKVREAQQSLARLQREIKSNSEGTLTLKMRMKQAKTNIAIARELTPNDYFVLYLGPKYQGNAKALEAAARFMSRQELAEILVGYSNNLLQREDVPTPSFPPVLSRSTQSISK